MLRFRRALTLVALIASGTALNAYGINPLKNKYHRHASSGGVWERVSETVHEDITDAATRCIELRRAEPSNTRPCVLDAPTIADVQRGNKWNAVIRGVWWNDDPNQHLFGVHYATWAVWMRDAKGIAKTGRNWLGREAVLDNGYRMQYRSHYGDMQFLHAMANADGEDASAIRDRTIGWLRFAYGVATGRIDPDATMADVDDPVARTVFTAQPGWTVNHLFAPKYTLGLATIPDVALGSMLHVVQDSFSDAHAQRAYDASAACPLGRIVEFHSYTKQDPGRHGAADTRSAWRTNAAFTASSNPVEVSAKMIAFVNARADWKREVEPYLRQTALCLDTDARPSGPGPYA